MISFKNRKWSKGDESIFIHFYNTEKIDYSKLPFWSKIYSLRKFWCFVGLHIPVRCDNSDGTFEVFCQECAEPMSIEQWEKFFAKAKAG